MPEIEITGEIGELTKALDGLKIESEFEPGSVDSDIKEINENFKDTSFGSTDFTIDDEGKLENSKGEKVDPTAINEKMLDGDFSGALEDLGFDIDKMDENIKENIKSQEELYKKSSGYEQRQNLTDSKKIGDEIVEKEGVSEDPNPDDPESLTEKDKETLEKIQEIKSNELNEEKDSKGGEEKKSWVDTLKEKGTTIAKLLAGALAAAEVAKLIKQHQNAMNGCWIVNTNTGKKCKPAFLQCGDNVPNPINSECHLPRTSGSTSSGKAVQLICDEINQQIGEGICECGPTSNQNCLDLSQCLNKVNNPKTPKKKKESFTYSTATDSDPKPCITLGQACQQKGPTTNSCAIGCGTGGLPKLPKGFHYQCVEVSFWSAAADWTKNAAHDIIKGGASIIGDGLKTIFKALWPWLIGIVILAIIGYVIYYFYQKSQNNQTLAKIQELELAAKMKAAPAFNFFN